jgi:hypothetical protein
MAVLEVDAAGLHVFGSICKEALASLLVFEEYNA